MALLHDAAATWSFILFVLSLIATVGIYLWMRFCYFPGGYKSTEVIDIGELAMYNAMQKPKKGEKYYGDEEEGEEGDDKVQSALDELYYEMTPRSQQDPNRQDWASVGQSEHDLEEGASRYDEDEPSPSTHSMSEAGRGYSTHLDSPSVASPAQSYGAPSAGRTRFADDASEGTTMTPHTQTGSHF